STELKTQNLDSVLYLYKRRTDGWGSYIAKNDNAEGLASRIEQKLTSGEYRVMVKAASVLMKGSFSVRGQCSGTGCPVSGGGECGPDDTTLPNSTDYTQRCATQLEAILTTPVTGAPATCGEQNLERRAVAFYKSYWDVGDQDPSVAV